MLQCLQREIRADRPRAIADQQGQVGHLARLSAFYDDSHFHALALANEVVMHASGRQQAGDSRVMRIHAPVGEDEDRTASFDSLRRAAAQSVHRAIHRARPFVGRKEERQRRRLDAGPVDRLDLLEVSLREDRAGQPELTSVKGRLLEQIALSAEVDADRRHELLADRVERRVAHLGEQLLEVGEQELRAIGEYGQGGVVAHGAGGLRAVDRHRLQQDAEILLCIPERLLQVDQRLLVELMATVAAGLGVQKRVQVHQVVPQPLAVGLSRRQLRLDRGVVDDAAALRVHQEHPSGVNALLEQHLLRRDVENAHLRGHDQRVVGRDEVTEGTQSVAVEHRANAVSVGEGDEGRAIPGLDEAGVVVVEVAFVL